MKEDWDAYWQKQHRSNASLYGTIAAFYRRWIIMPMLTQVLSRWFKPGSLLLHAGCGSGQVDRESRRFLNIDALDISPEALLLYAQTNGEESNRLLGSIFDIPAGPNLYDGVYNLGVMEHFSESEIMDILKEYRRVLKPHGLVVLFWPHRWSSSVWVLRGVHFVLNHLLKKDIRLHPEEITHLRSRAHAQALMQRAGFLLKAYTFSLQDGFTQAVIVAEKS